MFCTTIIPTIGRDTLEKSVLSVLNQQFTAGDFEVIVVNDSGVPLPEAEWQKSPCVKVITTNKRERSVARNTGAALGQGTYFHFLDDDDWVEPNFLDEMYRFTLKFPQAVWLYSGAVLLDERNHKQIELFSGAQGNGFVQAMSGEWIPLQSSLISAKAFFEVGGFNHSMKVSEDLDLCRRMGLRGDFAGLSKPLAFILRGPNWKTSSDSSQSVASSLRTRELILNEPGVFQRLVDSAKTSYWRGRVTRFYLASIIWNLKRKKILPVISRSFFGLISIPAAGWSALSGTFWKSLRSDHITTTIERDTPAESAT
ncbi:MAG: glycosyltransferase [Anaerolineaceae bacterium]|nr:glycosyltransferase [Anaerolineaceae bacterium]